MDTWHHLALRLRDHAVHGVGHLDHHLPLALLMRLHLDHALAPGLVNKLVTSLDAHVAAMDSVVSLLLSGLSQSVSDI